MSDVGTTHEDLEQFLAEHHLVGAGLRREGMAPLREGNTSAYWSWDGIYNGLKRSGEIVTVGPGGMTGMRSVTGIEARNFPIWMNAQILMPGERTQGHRNTRSETRLVCEAPAKDAFFVCEHEAYPMARGDVVISPSWTFHDHWNEGDIPALWVDGYDNGYCGGENLATAAIPWVMPGPWPTTRHIPYRPCATPGRKRGTRFRPWMPRVNTTPSRAST
jgi:gentisate 1,2-dioxygenase